MDGGIGLPGFASRVASDQSERFNRLWRPVFENLEIGGRKVRHSSSAFVFDNDIEQDFNGSDGDLLVLTNGFRWILRPSRRNQSGCQKHDGEFFHGVPRNGLVNE